MSMHSDINPTLNAVLAALISRTDIKPKTKENLVSALRSVEKWTGMPLQHIAADMPSLRARFDAITPHMAGVNSKTLANVKSLSRKAIALSGLVPEVRLSQGLISNSPVWRGFIESIPNRRLRNSLQPFATWAAANQVQPQEVDNAAFDRFIRYRDRTSLRGQSHRILRAATKSWNEVVDLKGDPTLSKVDVPPSRLRKTHVPIEAFPPSLWEEWNAFARWAHGEDRFGDGARPRPLAQSSIEIIRQHVHRAASSLVKSGYDINRIASLRDLVEVENFRAILTYRFEEVGRKVNHVNTSMTRYLIELARDAVKVDPEHLDALKSIAKKMPVPLPELSERNHRRLIEFDDPVVLQRLVAAPDAIWKEAMANPRKWHFWFLAQMQAALAIDILIHMPIRLGNLVALKFDKHVILRKQGASSLILSAEETKTGQQVQFDLPAQLAERLRAYRFEHAPKVLGRALSHLFVNRDGGTKDFKSVRDLIQRYLKSYVGLHINPHLFRHLAVKLILDDAPGAHVLAQQLLGHKKVETTATYYAGFDTKRAAKHHQQLLSKALQQMPSSGGRP